MGTVSCQPDWRCGDHVLAVWLMLSGLTPSNVNACDSFPPEGHTSISTPVELQDQRPRKSHPCYNWTTTSNYLQVNTIGLNIAFSILTFQYFCGIDLIVSIVKSIKNCQKVDTKVVFTYSLIRYWSLKMFILKVLLCNLLKKYNFDITVETRVSRSCVCYLSFSSPLEATSKTISCHDRQ